MNKIFILLIFICLYSCTNKEFEAKFNANSSFHCIICPDYNKHPFCVDIAIKGEISKDAYLLIRDTTNISKSNPQIKIPQGKVDTLIRQDWYQLPLLVEYISPSKANNGNLELTVDFGYLKYNSK